MFSHSNHHHQNVPGSCPALTTAHTACLGLTSAPDQLATHHRHLESLLDSALATVTLIHATHTTTLLYTSHVVQVSQALAHLIANCPPTHTTPTRPVPTPTHPDDNTPTAAPKATYAAAADSNHHQSSLVTTSDLNTVKQRCPSSTSDLSRNARVVICFDHKRDAPTRVDAMHLYSAIDDAIPGFSIVSGLKWSRQGNLFLYPARNRCTADFLLLHAHTIWKAIRPLLKLLTGYPRPLFETDKPWHSVVFHGAPTPLTLDINGEDVAAWLENDVKGAVRAISILCRPEQFSTRSSVAVRVSLSSAADAQHLVDNGGSFFGTHCRVRHYIGRKSCSVSPSPTCKADSASPPPT
ncbi:hypothetical protein C8R44DRAFT_752562 [Mycena epipterygia]|nr:hypothetical protein C8R44DRAFT_752562 [Mycena epipterygia]